MSEITVRVAKFVRLLDYLAALELDPHAAAREAGLSVAQLRAAAPDSTLSARQYARLYKTAVDQMQRLGQPVPWGAGVGSEAFALMCHCLISARTLGEALALAERFGRLLMPQLGYRVSLTLAEGGDRAGLVYQVEFDEQSSGFIPPDWGLIGQQSAVIRASGLQVWHALCGWLTGQPLRAEAVTVAAPPFSAGYAQALGLVFRCPVTFHAERNALWFSADHLQRRIVHSGESLREFLANAVYQLIAIDREPASVSAAIRSLVVVELPGPLPGFAEIARQLGLSESSLRRRLQAEGSSYQEIKDEVRCTVAMERLRASRDTVAELGEYLGFAEPGSFVRSFKSWTGVTPQAWREQQSAKPGKQPTA